MYRWLGFIFVSLYIIGILAGTYYATSHAQEIQMISEKLPLAAPWLLGITVIGLLAFIFLFLSAGTSIDVVYVRANTDSLKQQESQQQANNPLANNQRQVIAISQIITENQAYKRRLLDKVIKQVCQQLEASVGAVYIQKLSAEARVFQMAANYAYYREDNVVPQFQIGEGLVGQVAKDGKWIQLENVPEHYVVVSGLGKARPAYLLLLPIKNTEDEVWGVMELASFQVFSNADLAYLQEVALLLAKELETPEYHNI